MAAADMRRESRRHLTKTEYAVEVLREWIHRGELPPGRRLAINDLSDALGISPTPIREALRLLQADHLVDYRPHVGAVVAEVPSETIIEIHQIRSMLEPFATGLAVRNLTDERLEELERLHRALATASLRGRRIADVNAAWHWALYESANSAYLEDLIRRLWDAIPWRTMWAVQGRAKRSVVEHKQIMEAVRAGSADLAAARMREHILSGAETLVSRVELPRTE